MLKNRSRWIDFSLLLGLLILFGVMRWGERASRPHPTPVPAPVAATRSYDAALREVKALLDEAHQMLARAYSAREMRRSDWDAYLAAQRFGVDVTIAFEVDGTEVAYNPVDHELRMPAYRFPPEVLAVLLLHEGDHLHWVEEWGARGVSREAYGKLLERDPELRLAMELRAYAKAATCYQFLKDAGCIRPREAYDQTDWSFLETAADALRLRDDPVAFEAWVRKIQKIPKQE